MFYPFRMGAQAYGLCSMVRVVGGQERPYYRIPSIIPLLFPLFLPYFPLSFSLFSLVGRPIKPAIDMESAFYFIAYSSSNDEDGGSFAVVHPLGSRFVFFSFLPFSCISHFQRYIIAISHFPSFLFHRQEGSG